MRALRFIIDFFRKAKYYYQDKEVFEAGVAVIAPGNDMSLSFMVWIDAVFLIIMTFVNHFLEGVAFYGVTFYCAVAATAIAVLFFAVKYRTPKYHWCFYYLTSECMMFYSIYNMNFPTASAAVIFMTVAIVLPIFYMHNFLSQVVFTTFNVFVILHLAFLGPEKYFGYIKEYTFTIIAFSVIGLMIHYAYQVNRAKELLNFKTTRDNEIALEIQTTFESLSGLLQRSSFVEFTEKAISKAVFEDYMAIGILDIDHFKLINDTYGHQLGDETITAIGKTIAESFNVSLVTPRDISSFELDRNANQGNIAGRLGGDEFIFLITEVSNREDLEKYLSDLVANLASAHIGPLTDLHASIGISIVNKYKSYDRLYHEADTALYVAKENGRNQIVFYEDYMEEASATEKKTIDDLTGLLGASSFKEALAVALPGKSDGTYAVVNLDIENFKSYNAQYGFEEGDKFLKEMGRLLQERYPNELISRFSDDHFMAFVPLEDLEHNIGRLKFHLKKFRGDYRHSIRAGVYIINNQDEDVNLACDHAKFACDTIRGRFDTQIQYFDEGLNQKRDKYQYVIEHIDEAIDKEWLTVYYQPIIRTYTSACCGLEALCRWVDPNFGILPPSDFIETLEQSRLIYKLDLYMVEQICKNYRKCLKENLPIVPVSVNISRLDFDAVDVVSEIEGIISEYHVPREALHIEITESALTDSKDRLREIVDQFQQIGYQLWMDDFGSGYSSLNALKDYQFNVIKFDMEFLSDTGSRARAILTSIVDMSKKLGLQTLAEGVETEEQYAFLKSIGCEFVQGYLFSKPVPLDRFYENINSSQESYIVGIERLVDKKYYDTVGQKNVLNRVLDYEDDGESFVGNSRAVTVVEFYHSYVSVLMYTSAFEQRIQDVGYKNYESFIELLNQGNLEKGSIYIDMLNDCVAYKRDNKQIIDTETKKYVLYIKYLTENQDGKSALIAALSDITQRDE